jgi:hypothetical protein
MVTVESVIFVFYLFKTSAESDHAALVVDVILKFMPKMAQHSLYRHRGRIAQGADGFSTDFVRHVIQQIQILLAPLTGFDAMYNPIEPTRALPAGCALAA